MDQLRSKKQSVFFYLIGLLMLLVSSVSFATQPIVIAPNTIVSYPKTYDNVTLDMSNGSFIIKNNATLTIKNSIINGTLSKANPNLINVENGQLSIINSQANIKSVNIAPHPETQSLINMILVGTGKLTLDNNKFKIDQAYTAGFLITTSNIPTSDIKITNNYFEKFHGVLYLIGTDGALVSNNMFMNNSYGNIVLIGNNSKITQNTVYFSGGNRLGDGIDVIDSTNIIVSNNYLFTPTCRGIYVFNSRDVMVANNRISGGITYAMIVITYPEKFSLDKSFESPNYLKEVLAQHEMKNVKSANITIINNYMAQNRFGIAASDTDGLLIKNNIFIQRFEDNDARQFWTNNSILIKNVTGLVWNGNLYKEAYTQEENGDNSNSSKFVTFPATGGVTL
jgi:parallel beta-helix repeat protein